MTTARRKTSGSRVAGHIVKMLRPLRRRTPAPDASAVSELAWRSPGPMPRECLRLATARAPPANPRRVAGFIGIGGRLPPELPAGLRRNHWPASLGISGRFASDSAASFAVIEAEGREEWLTGIRKELQEKTYRPAPVRRMMIPKPGDKGERPLGSVMAALVADPDRSAVTVTTNGDDPAGKAIAEEFMDYAWQTREYPRVTPSRVRASCRPVAARSP